MKKTTGISLAVAILGAAWHPRVTAQQVTTTSVTATGASARAKDPGVRTGISAGTPLAGLTPGQTAMFNEGKNAFEETAFVQNPPTNGDAGLGPGFNSDSCKSCHAFPATGGTSPKVNPQVTAATAMGARNALPWFIKADGPVLEARFKTKRDGSADGGVHNLFSISGRRDANGCTLAQEDFSNRDNISFRTATPTFGLGLIESIPDGTLISNLAANPLLKTVAGISGRFNTSGNDGSITRFGWKAQNKSLAIFSGEAYNVEMGVTSILFPQERNETAGCMFNPGPESDLEFDTGGVDDVALFATFMRFLAPPTRGPSSPSISNGEGLFTSVGCALCHTPSLQTGKSTVAALSQKAVPLYSDLALHAMGSTLADSIAQGEAAGDEFRTAPLWGLGQRIYFLHDARTSDLSEAIQAHSSDATRGTRASEANTIIRRFNALSTQQQQDLLNFLRSL